MIKFKAKFIVCLVIISVISFHLFTNDRQPQPSFSVTYYQSNSTNITKPQKEQSQALFQDYMSDAGKIQIWLLVLLLFLSINWILKNKN